MRTLRYRLNRLTRWRLARPTRIEYADVVDHALEDLPDEERFVPCVLPNWDNTPRSGVRGLVYERATPELFRRYLDKGAGEKSGIDPGSTQ